MSTFILVHGAWAGSWGWSKVKPMLESHGHRVIAVDLPGNGVDKTKASDVNLSIYAHYLCGVIDASYDPVILVGHSGGGIVISQVAEMRPKKIKQLVYLAGHLLPSGMGYKDLVTKYGKKNFPHKGAAGLAQLSKDGLVTTIKPEDAINIFFNSASKDDAKMAAEKLSPQPEGGRAIKAYLTKRNFGSVPRSYIECEKDMTVFLYLQRKMHELTPCHKVYTLDTDHAPQLSMPGELTSILNTIAKSIS